MAERMPLDEARKVIWPFRTLKGQPMGTLIERKQLSLQDLGFAIENAWDERVRQAAITFMLARLDQEVRHPKSSAGFLHVVSGGRSYSQRQQHFWTYIYGAIFGAIGVLLLVFFKWWVFDNLPTTANASLSSLSSPIGIIAALAGVALGLGIAWVLSRLFNIIGDNVEKRIKNHRRGQEGEDSVVTVMQQTLDGNWYLFRNIVLPGRQKTDLDSVLVGPNGVWVLEVKTFNGEYRNIGEHWEYRAGNGWELCKPSPSRQAQNNALHLSNFLKADNIRQWVTPVVVWANPACPLTVENPSVAVWSLDRLPDQLVATDREKQILEPVRNQIIEKLTKLCQRQEESQ